MVGCEVFACVVLGPASVFIDTRPVFVHLLLRWKLTRKPVNTRDMALKTSNRNFGPVQNHRVSGAVWVLLHVEAVSDFNDLFRWQLPASKSLEKLYSSVQCPLVSLYRYIHRTWRMAALLVAFEDSEHQSLRF